MASAIIEITTGTWSEITATSGSVYHKSGGMVAYTEAETQPTGYSSSTPVSKTSKQTEDFQFYDVATDESMWCYAINEDAVITVTPAE